MKKGTSGVWPHEANVAEDAAVAQNRQCRVGWPSPPQGHRAGSHNSPEARAMNVVLRDSQLVEFGRCQSKKAIEG